MPATTWTPTALASEVRAWQGSGWRAVEAQHQVASMRLVRGNLADQQVGEQSDRGHGEHKGMGLAIIAAGPCGPAFDCRLSPPARAFSIIRKLFPFQVVVPGAQRVAAGLFQKKEIPFMQIGIPAEIRSGETRVAATPETVKKLAASGHHKLLVQAGAGLACSIPDAEFAAAGATMVSDVAQFRNVRVMFSPPSSMFVAPTASVSATDDPASA